MKIPDLWPRDDLFDDAHALQLLSTFPTLRPRTVERRISFQFLSLGRCIRKNCFSRAVKLRFESFGGIVGEFFREFRQRWSRDQIPRFSIIRYLSFVFVSWPGLIEHFSCRPERDFISEDKVGCYWKIYEQLNKCAWTMFNQSDIMQIYLLEHTSSFSEFNWKFPFLYLGL